MNNKRRPECNLYWFTCCGKDCDATVSIEGKNRREAIKSLVRSLGWLNVSSSLIYCDVCKDLLGVKQSG